MLPLVVHQNGEEELGCSRWSFTRINGVEELGCSRWSFTRIRGGEELGCSRWSFTRTGGEELGCSRWSFTRIYWGGGARVLPLVVHHNIVSYRIVSGRGQLRSPESSS